jgi:hypothetical protein
MSSWLRGLRDMKPAMRVVVIFGLLAACTDSNDLPPSIEVDGPLVGVFAVQTTMDDTTTTAITASVSEPTDTACTGVAADRATLAIDGRSIELLPDEHQVYGRFEDALATHYVFEAVRGPDRLSFDATMPAPIAVTFTQDRISWSPANAAGVSVVIDVADTDGDGDAAEFHVALDDDSGSVDIPAGTLDHPGTWKATIRRRAHAGFAQSHCLGSWTADLTTIARLEI